MSDTNNGVIQEQGFLFEDQNMGFKPLTEEEDPFNTNRKFEGLDADPDDIKSEK